MSRHRAILSAGSVGLLVAGCGQAVVLAGPTAQTVTQFVVTHTGYHPPDVRCPSGIPAKVGRSFTCQFTGPDGKYEAHLRILSVHGRRVNYDIRTEITERDVLVGPTEREISDFVFRHTRFRPTDVTCPSGVLAHAGTRYQCRFTGPDGAYTAYVTITAVNGRTASNQIVTRRTGS
jgi:hypothetical protein